MPLVSGPPLVRPAWPMRALLGILALVLGLHLWILGGAPLHWPQSSEGLAPEATAITFSTRTLAAETATTVSPPARSKPPARNLARPVAPAPETPSDNHGSNVAPPLEAAALPPPQAAADSPSTNAPPTDASDATAEVPAASAAGAPAAAPPQIYAFPPPVQMNYDLSAVTDGRRDVGSASIVWTHDGINYQASLAATKFGIKLRQWTSKGALTVAGLAPVRFGEKGLRRSEVASHFVREERKVIFSANTPEVPLMPGAQDNLSVFMQLASLWAGNPQRYTAGDAIAFQTIGPRQAETWTFVVSPEERIAVPGGMLQTTKLTREATAEFSTKAEVWLAPQLAYLPARIRLSETNGNVLDMAWTDSQQP